MIVGFTVASRLKSEITIIVREGDSLVISGLPSRQCDKSEITICPGWKRYQGGAASESRIPVGG
jgi:hypothetical protein